MKECVLQIPGYGEIDGMISILCLQVSSWHPLQEVPSASHIHLIFNSLTSTVSFNCPISVHGISGIPNHLSLKF